MVKAKKIILIIGLVLLSVGFIVSGVAFALAGFDFSAVSSSAEMIDKSAQWKTDEVSLIDVKVLNANVTVARSDDELIHIHCVYRESGDLDLRLDGSVAVVQGSFESSFRYQLVHGLFSGLGSRDENVTIYIPENAHTDLKLVTSNSVISVNGFKNAESTSPLVCSTSNGAINLTDVELGGEARLKSSNGRINVSSLRAASLTGDTSNGQIAIENAAISGRCDLETSNGRVILKNVKSESINAETNNGRINISGISAESIVLKSSNGDIEGTVSGRYEDYRISTHTSNGTRKPENKDSGKYTLDARTSNGDIELSFDN